MNRPSIKTQEQDIDYLIVEEILSDEGFQKWLLERFNISNFSYDLVGAWRSTVKNGGETDIAIGIENDEDKILLMIENKIYAPEQPDQPERYHERGKERVRNEEWTQYHTAILSPKKYLKDYNHRYEQEITYEELKKYFENKSSKRAEFQEKVIQEGIRKARTGYQRTTDELTDDFYRYYENLARSHYPELEYRKPEEVASGNSWIRFPTPLPANATIIHKSGRGQVDLQISDYEGDKIQFRKDYRDSLDEMSVHNTGESVSVRLNVPKLEKPGKITAPENYRQEIIESLDSASKLMNWYIENYY